MGEVGSWRAMEGGGGGEVRHRQRREGARRVGGVARDAGCARGEVGGGSAVAGEWRGGECGGAAGEEWSGGRRGSGGGDGAGEGFGSGDQLERIWGVWRSCGRG